MANQGFLIRHAQREDCPDIRRLIQELADYEKMPDGPKIDAKVLEEDGFGPDPFFQCYVAETLQEPGKLVGYALYFYNYSTWEGRSVYMEDLYVTPSHRGHGIGKALWREVVKACRYDHEQLMSTMSFLRRTEKHNFIPMSLSKGCCRCCFSVLDWNKPSIDFYEGLGAVNVTAKEGWLAFRMNQEAMIRFASGQESKPNH